MFAKLKGVAEKSINFVTFEEMAEFINPIEKAKVSKVEFDFVMKKINKTSKKLGDLFQAHIHDPIDLQVELKKQDLEMEYEKELKNSVEREREFDHLRQQVSQLSSKFEVSSSPNF